MKPSQNLTARPQPSSASSRVYARPQLERLGAWQVHTGIGGSAPVGLDRFFLPDPPQR